MSLTYPPVAAAALARFMGHRPVEEIEEFSAKYEAVVERDYLTIRDWLPERCEAFLEIGCGVGGLSVYIVRHYQGGAPTPDAAVMDGSEGRERRPGYHEGFQPYVDRAGAVALLRANVPECRVTDYPPDPSLTIPVDLIVSTKSWGHHYPVDVYLGLALRSLRRGGRVIMDLRRRRDGIGTMTRAGFAYVGKIFETQKCERVVFSR